MPGEEELPEITDEIPENELEAEAEHAYLVTEDGDTEEDDDGDA